MEQNRAIETPQEVEVWYILPTIRKELAIELVKVGLKQKEAAKKLNLTEAAVSQYLKDKRGKEIVLNKKIKGKISNAAKRLLNKNSKCYVLREIQNICDYVRKSRFLCYVHKKKGAGRRCNICGFS